MKTIENNTAIEINTNVIQSDDEKETLLNFFEKWHT
jgi:hypothetical protein